MTSAKMLTIRQWRDDAEMQLAAAGIGTARLDAEILLAHTLRKSRTYIHAYHEEVLDDRHRDIADARLQLRLERVPIAYIVGHKEFYGRQFIVTTATLIPRPESETIIDLLKEFDAKQRINSIVDIGTGSGCLAITAKLELPHCSVSATDISDYALAVAAKNAARHDATVSFIKSDLLSRVALTADVIVANLPYVDVTWARSPETDHEPAVALFADEGGLALIKKLIIQATTALKPGGRLIIEADPRQFQEIIAAGAASDFTHIVSKGFVIVLQKD